MHSVIQPFIHSFIHSFIHPCIHSFSHSFIHSFIRASISFIHFIPFPFLSFIRSFIYSLFHWFIDSSTHEFTHSLIHWFIRSVVHGFFHVISLASQPPFSSFVDAPHSYSSLLLHLKNFPIGHHLPIVVLIFRNFRPGAGRAGILSV